LPDIAGDLLSLGDAELERGNNRAADSLFSDDLAICHQRPRQAAHAADCIYGLNDLAGAKWFENRLDEAEPLYRQALVAYRREYGTSTVVAVILGNLGGVLDGRGDLLGADSMYRASLAEYERAGGHYLPQRAFTLGNLADNLATRGRLAEAEPLVREQIALITRTESADHPDAGLAWVRLGAIEREGGHLVAADADTRRGLAIVAKSGPIARRLFVDAETRASLVLLAKGDATKAHALLQTVLDSASAEFTHNDARFAEVQVAMGEALLALHDNRSAAAQFKAAYLTYQASFGPAHPSTVDAERRWRRAGGG
jgi:tetratricopeptide (TPR) repeat protein